MLLRTCALLVVVSLLGCQKQNPNEPAKLKLVMAVAELSPAKAATTRPTMNNVSGTVLFTPSAGGVRVTAEVHGLPPNSKHGFHIHEKGDLSAPDLMSTGGHFNPGGHVHGGPTTSAVHAGDFGNLQSDSNGFARLELDVTDISINTGQPNDIVGKAVIVHEKADDLKSQPTGNSGARVAGGLIELKQDSEIRIKNQK